MTTVAEWAAIRDRDEREDASHCVEDRRALLALADRLQALNVSLADRVAAQSELLSKKAEKDSTIPDDQLPTLASLRGLLKPPAYDPAFGDARLCTCGHVYRNHFRNTLPAMCAGCRCDEFTEKGGPLDVE